MTDQMERLINRVDGDLPAVRRTSPATGHSDIVTPSTHRPAAREVSKSKKRAAPKGAGALVGRVPRAIERLALLEPGELYPDLAAAELM